MSLLMNRLDMFQFVGELKFCTAKDSGLYLEVQLPMTEMLDARDSSAVGQGRETSYTNS